LSVSEIRDSCSNARHLPDAASRHPVYNALEFAHPDQGARAMACSPTRRSALMLIAGAAALPAAARAAPTDQVITVHKDPGCGCCSGWVAHLQAAGFTVNAIDTRELDAIKARLGVPDDLAACHTAQVAGYIVEGHVPASALARLLAEKPDAAGLAVPGMPIGSPGMEGGAPEPYDVILFGAVGRRTYMRFLGEKVLG
jgi:hypothetical protein